MSISKDSISILLLFRSPKITHVFVLFSFCKQFPLSGYFRSCMHEIHNFRLYYYRSCHHNIIDCHCTASIITIPERNPPMRRRHVVTNLFLGAVDQFSYLLLLQRYKQVAQLSQRDRAAEWVSYSQKWKTGSGRQYFTDILGLSSTTVP